MKKKESTIKNKIWAVIFIALGIMSELVSNDGTFLVFALALGIPLFFAKKNYIY